jgi:hypothetical protein
MGCAEVIALDEVRARKQWTTLRQQLHERFDQWLDALEMQWHELPPTFAEVTTTVWDVRQHLTGGIAETIVAHAHRGAHDRQQDSCPQCHRVLKAREHVGRTVATMVGLVQLERPYFSCRRCRHGPSPLDDVLGLRAGHIQPDVPQGVAPLVTAVPYDTASTLLGDLSGIAVSSERMHALTHQAAEGGTVLDVAPSREEIARRVAAVAAGRWRRPVLVLGIDGAYVLTRPESAQGRRPGQAHQRASRARWRGQWREAKGCRFSLLDSDRLVQVLSWPHGQTAEELGEALRQVKDAGVMPEDPVRLCVVSDGAEWLWKYVQALFPHARQGLDYDHGAAYIHKVMKAPYGPSGQALEWAEATMTRLYVGKVGSVLAGLGRRRLTSADAAKAMANGWDHLDAHRAHTHYRTLRRGGYPLGSGGIASSNKFICHVRLERSGAWWYEVNSHQMLALRCAQYNGTLPQVFKRHQQRLRET